MRCVGKSAGEGLGKGFLTYNERPQEEPGGRGAGGRQVSMWRTAEQKQGQNLIP